MDLELIKKLDYFNIYANIGFQFDGIDKCENYSIAYHNKIKDYWYNLREVEDCDQDEDFEKYYHYFITLVFGDYKKLRRK